MAEVHAEQIVRLRHPLRRLLMREDLGSRHPEAGVVVGVIEMPVCIDEQGDRPLPDAAVCSRSLGNAPWTKESTTTLPSGPARITTLPPGPIRSAMFFVSWTRWIGVAAMPARVAANGSAGGAAAGCCA
jgi:hypothetical protein